MSNQPVDHSPIPPLGTLQSSPFRIESCGVTDTGLVRKNNEDSFLCDDQLGFWAVADGMGGHDAGEIASDLAVSRLHSLIGALDNWSAANLQSLVTQVNQEIYDYGRTHNLPNGLGTTLTALLRFNEQELCLAHIGDSRLYRIHDDEIEQITTDHSWVQQQIDVGEITMDEARFHPLKNVIMRSLGYDTSVEADILRIPLLAGDRMLIASDGLTNKIQATEMLSAMLRTESNRAALQGMVQIALERGGEDNITAVIVQVDGA